MSIYDLTGHLQLDEAVTEQGPDYLDFQTRVAEQVLGATDPPFSDPDALQIARDALVIQVNWQEATGTDARMLQGSSRAGVTFRSEKGTNLLPVADPLAAALWSGAASLQATADGSAVAVAGGGGSWRSKGALR